MAEVAARVVPPVDARNGTELAASVAGGMRLPDYLPTCTLELAVHTADLAATGRRGSPAGWSVLTPRHAERVHRPSRADAGSAQRLLAS